MLIKPLPSIGMLQKQKQTKNPVLSIENDSWNDDVVNGGGKKCLKLKKKKMFHVVDQKLTNKILQHLYLPTLWL